MNKYLKTSFFIALGIFPLTLGLAFWYDISYRLSTSKQSETSSSSNTQEYYPASKSCVSVKQESEEKVGSNFVVEYKITNRCDEEIEFLGISVRSIDMGRDVIEKRDINALNIYPNDSIYRSVFFDRERNADVSGYATNINQLTPASPHF